MKHWIVLLAALVMAGCASITNPFVHMAPDYTIVPQEELKAVALDIERAVQEGNREPRIEDRAGLVVSDAVILQAIHTRAARAELVNEFLDKGYGREDRDGLLRVLKTSEYKKGTTGKQRSRDALLVMNENNDRWALYETLVKSSKLPRRSLSAVQDAFHQARLEVMKAGQRYEGSSGETVVKAP